MPAAWLPRSGSAQRYAQSRLLADPCRRMKNGIKEALCIRTLIKYIERLLLHEELLSCYLAHCTCKLLFTALWCHLSSISTLNWKILYLYLDRIVIHSYKGSKAARKPVRPALGPCFILVSTCGKIVKSTLYSLFCLKMLLAGGKVSVRICYELLDIHTLLHA